MSSSDACPSAPLKRILFPMKNFNKDESGQVTDGGSTTVIANNDSVGWIGMTPLEFVEKIATATEQKMALSSRRGMGRLCIQTTQLSAPAPALPAMALPAIQRNNTNVSAASAESDEGNNNSKDDDIQVIMCCDEFKNCGLKTKLSGQKRGRRMSDIDGYEDDDEEASDAPVVNAVMSDLSPWDPSFIIDRDPYSEKARNVVEKLTILALQLEGMPKYNDVLPSYKRVRDYLEVATLGWAHQQTFSEASYLCMHDADKQKRRLVLDDLYDSTVLKMEGLIKMAKDIADDEAAEDFAKSSLYPSDTVVPVETGGRHECSSVGENDGHESSRGNSNSKECSKKDFAEYMGNWLRENWTNPYPDDEGLLEIAEACGTSPTVVSNWLINARTRKWRPAIVKAFDKGRPADLLKEDAINIFDGKPLRELDGVDVIKS